jgi:nucleotide-binding universal stress UspA family protein
MNSAHPTVRDGCRSRPAASFRLPRGFRSILVDVDADAEAQPALERAIRVARGSMARLRIVDVVPSPDVPSPRAQADLDDSAYLRRRERLERLASSVTGVVADCDLLVGRPARALIDEVRRSGHDLLMRLHWRDVVSRVPRELRDVNAHLFRECPCPVRAVGYGAVPARPHVVAAIRVSDVDAADDTLNAKILETAARLAFAENGSATLLHAWTAPAEGRVRGEADDEGLAVYLDAARRRAETSLSRLAPQLPAQGSPVRLELRKGEPDWVIPPFVVSSAADVLVVGTEPRQGLRRLLHPGLAERLLRVAPCSVVAVKQD